MSNPVLLPFDTVALPAGSIEIVEGSISTACFPPTASFSSILLLVPPVPFTVIVYVALLVAASYVPDFSREYVAVS